MPSLKNSDGGVSFPCSPLHYTSTPRCSYSDGSTVQLQVAVVCLNAVPHVQQSLFANIPQGPRKRNTTFSGRCQMLQWWANQKPSLTVVSSWVQANARRAPPVTVLFCMRWEELVGGELAWQAGLFGGTRDERMMHVLYAGGACRIHNFCACALGGFYTISTNFQRAMIVWDRYHDDATIYEDTVVHLVFPFWQVGVVPRCCHLIT